MAADLLPSFSNKLKNKKQKIIKKDDSIYKEFTNQGMVYIYNETNANTTELVNAFKSLGFVRREYNNYFKFSNAIKSDAEAIMKYTEDYCVAVVGILVKRQYNEDVLKTFQSDNCVNLECKPKLFFELKLPNFNNDDTDETDSAWEYDLPVQADFLIYKHTSPTVIEDLSRFLKRFQNQNDSRCFLNELTHHLGSLTDTPTVHDTLTRRLHIKRRKTDFNMKILYFKNLNRKILMALQYMDDCIDFENEGLSHVLGKLKEDLKLVSVKDRILANPCSDIENGEEICKKIEAAVDNFIKEC